MHIWCQRELCVLGGKGTLGNLKPGDEEQSIELPEDV